MLIFISGGVRSGKSTLGEKYAKKLSKGNIIYLATSKVYDEEISKRIENHQKSRAQKGFSTIEKSEDIGKIARELKKDDTVLLDCLGTLVANEMFYDYTLDFNDEFKDQIISKVYSEILMIKESVSNLIIISNEIYSDGIAYDKATEKYVEAMGALHLKIAAISDTAIECVYGSNIAHKGDIL